jgi:hypothetical protein
LPKINWGQAAGEALFIMLGILLALAADTWWDERTERVQEREYLLALQGELELLRDQGLGVARVVVGIETSSAELLGISARWPDLTVPRDSVAELLIGLGEEIDWAPRLSVYEDLLNTGSVRIIRSEEVRHGLTLVMGAVEWVSDRRDRHNQFFWDQLDPYLRRNLPIVSVFRDYDLPPPPETWSPDEFVTSREFRNLVAVKSMSAQDVRGAADDLTEIIDSVLASVRSAAGA